MALLLHLRSGRARLLPSRLVVGRAETCGLRLEDPRVSGEHASFSWDGAAWGVRDLGSRNGTYVDGQRLSSGTLRALTKGTRVSFGADEDHWELSDAAAPGVVAEDVRSGEIIAASDGILLLPPSAPEVSIYGDSRGNWLLERQDAAPVAVADDEVLEVGGRAFRIRLPGTLAGTAVEQARVPLEAIHLRFAVSRDEEHVHLTVTCRGSEVLLDPREHGYTLLTLARARLADAGEPAAEQGWIERDELLKMLGVDANGLNVAIYRARGQLAAGGVDGAAGVVEVRRGQRRIGISPDRLEVVPL